MHLHRTLAVPSIACALLLSLSASAFADSYSDGKALYDAKNFAGALQKLQQASAERPTEAKVQWMIGLTQMKLRNGAGALAAFQTAQRLDPAVKFTKMDKFNDRMGRAQVMAQGGVPAVRPGFASPPQPGFAPRPAQPAFAPQPGGGVAFFKEPVLNQAARDMVQNRRMVRDYAGLLLPADVARLEQLVAEAGAKGADIRIVALPRVGTPLQALTERVYNLIKGTDRDVLVVAAPNGANARTAKIRANDMQRILVNSQKDFLISVGNGIHSVASKIAAVYGIKQTRAENKKKIWIWVLVGVGGLILLIIIIAVVRANQRKAEEAAAYKREYDAAVAMMDPVAEKLGDLQLSIQIVKDEDAEMLIKRGEANYFGAQGTLQKIAPPGKGDPNVAGVRRLAGQLQEASVALEKAENIVSRLTDGKPIDKEKILSQGGKKLGCYFCSKPMRDESAGHVVGIEIKSQKMDVLSCNSCYDVHQGGKMPNVRMVEYEGRPVHWSMVPAYDPWYDYYHHDRYRSTWVDAVVMATIFDWALWHSHPSPYVMWYPPGAYSYGIGYSPTYYNFDSYSAGRGDADVSSVIGGSWDQGGTPSGISFDAGGGYGGGGGGGDYGGGGVQYGGDQGGGGSGADPGPAGGRDVS